MKLFYCFLLLIFYSLSLLGQNGLDKAGELPSTFKKMSITVASPKDFKVAVKNYLALDTAGEIICPAIDKVYLAVDTIQFGPYSRQRPHLSAISFDGNSWYIMFGDTRFYERTVGNKFEVFVCPPEQTCFSFSTRISNKEALLNWTEMLYEYWSQVAR